MDALILAAGLGSRIRDVEACKPLTRVRGLSLLEIAVRQLAAAGASRVVVATGYRADLVEAALPGIAQRSGIAVEACRVGDYRKPNGYSVLAGSADFRGSFLLVMADHVLSSGVLRRLVEAGLPENGVVLAIDRDLQSPLVDPDDATWVATDERASIVRIGKDIDPYDAVDCGAFLVSPGLPRAIAAAIGDGKPGSLSDGMQRLADAGRAMTVDVTEEWWLDVDDARALDLAREQAPLALPDLFGEAEGGPVLELTGSRA